MLTVVPSVAEPVNDVEESAEGHETKDEQLCGETSSPDRFSSELRQLSAPRVPVPRGIRVIRIEDRKSAGNGLDGICPPLLHTLARTSPLSTRTICLGATFVAA